MHISQWDWTFWTAVGTEVRATWWGRWRWLWIGHGIIGVAIGAIAFVFGSGWSQISFAFLWLVPLLWLGALVCWPFAWLGSDLLSIRSPANPYPLRVWRPEEFLARFLGRVGPPLGVLGAAVIPFMAAVDYYNRADYPETSWLDAWAIHSLLYIVLALCYATVAALVSSLCRRPRRWLVTLLVGLGSSMLLFTLRPVDILGSGWLSVVGSALLLALPGAHILVFDDWLTVSIMGGIGILGGLWTWWIAARRYRRSRAVQRDE